MVKKLHGQMDSTAAADCHMTNHGRLNGEVANILITSYKDAARMLCGNCTSGI